jgi:hypothetical protein
MEYTSDKMEFKSKYFIQKDLSRYKGKIMHPSFLIALSIHLYLL